MRDNADLTSDLAEVFEGFERVQIENICEDGGVSIGEIAGEIVHSAEEIGDVLCIVNLTEQAHGKLSHELPLLLHHRIMWMTLWLWVKKKMLTRLTYI